MASPGGARVTVSIRGPKARVASLRSKVSALPKKAKPFYLTPEWKALVAAIIARRGRRCEDCGASSGRVYADHVIEISDGGPVLDEANVRLRCAACHGGKTAAEKRKRLGLG